MKSITFEQIHSPSSKKEFIKSESPYALTQIKNENPIRNQVDLYHVDSGLGEATHIGEIIPKRNFNKNKEVEFEVRINCLPDEDNNHAEQRILLTTSDFTLAIENLWEHRYAASLI